MRRNEQSLHAQAHIVLIPSKGCCTIETTIEVISKHRDNAIDTLLLPVQFSGNEH